MNKYLAYVKFSSGIEFANGEIETYETILNIEAKDAQDARDKVKAWEDREEETKIEHYYIQLLK